MSDSPGDDRLRIYGVRQTEYPTTSIDADRSNERLQWILEQRERECEVREPLTNDRDPKKSKELAEIAEGVEPTTERGHTNDTDRVIVSRDHSRASEKKAEVAKRHD